MSQETESAYHPGAPDMHKAIEHVFGTLTTAMNHALAKDPDLKTVPQYKAKLEELFQEKITPCQCEERC